MDSTLHYENLEMQVETLQKENLRLRSLLEKYEKTIKKRESSLFDSDVIKQLLNDQMKNPDVPPSDVVYICDKSGIIKFISPSAEKLFGYLPLELRGHYFTEFISEEDKERSVRIFKDIELTGIPAISYILHIRKKSGSFLKAELSSFPFITHQGERGTIGHVKDISFSEKSKRLFDLQIRLSDLSIANGMDNIIRLAIDEAELLTESKIGFFHFISDDQRTVLLQNWSSNTMSGQCRAKAKAMHYNIDEAGLWAECFYKKEPVIHNDYQSISGKKGMPEGHVQLKRQLVVPVIRNGKVKAIIGVGNKETDYDEKDADLFSRLMGMVWDIIQKKRYEAELRSSEKKFRTIIETALEGIIIVDKDNIITYTNFNYQELLGYSADELNGSSLTKLFFEDDRDDYFKRANFRREGGSQMFERRYRKKDGSCCWAIVSAVPVFENGEFAGAFAMVTDITSRKNTEEALRENREQLLTLINSVPDIICFKDGEGRWLVTNDFNLNMFQLEGVDYKGKKDSELADYSLFYRDAFLSCEKSDEISWRKKGLSRCEETIPRPDGSSRTFDVIKVPLFKENGERKALIVVGRDITERKKSEEALSINAERLRLTLEASGIVAWEIKAADYSYNEEGPAAEVFGPGPRLGINGLLEIVHEDDRPRVLREIEEAVKGIAEFNTKFRIVSGCGEIRWIAASGRLITDYYGKEKRLLGIARDITESKTAGDKLKASEVRFRNMFESHAAVMLLIDPEDGKIIDCNPAAEKFYGYPHSEFTEKYIYDVNMMPEKGVLERMQSTVNGEHKYFISSHRIANGKIKSVEVHSSPLSYDDKIILFSIIHDITDRIESEAKVRLQSAALNSAANAIAITDKAGTIEWVNQSFSSLTGYSEEDCIGRNPGELVKSGKHDSGFYSEMWERILSGKIWDGEIINKKKDSSLYYEHMTITPILNDNGDIEHFIAVKADISNRKKIEQELINAKEDAQKSDRLKSEFLAQMSHEIRTPINTILSFSSLLKMETIDKISAELADGFQIIENGGQRLIRTIDLILNMSEIQVGSYEAQFRENDIFSDILNNVFAEFRTVIQLKNLDFTLERHTENTVVKCDSYTVMQIFANLIDNAGKYTKTGFVKVRIYETKERLCVDVEDSGIGISDEYITKIFNPFSQEDTGYTRSFEGNGLGLALVKKYCKLNNAAINVKSVKGIGSTFTVSFGK